MPAHHHTLVSFARWVIFSPCLTSSIAFAALAFLCATPAAACRYTVREAAFVELDADQWRIYCCYGNDTPAETVAALRRATYASLFECNLGIEFVNLDEPAAVAGTDTPPAWRLAAEKAPRLPAVFLAGRGDHVLPVEIPLPGVRFEVEARAALEQLVFSPLHQEIRRLALDTYGLVLLIEGEDARRNEEVSQTVHTLAGAVTERLRQSDEAAALPIGILKLPRNRRDAEQPLLWCLGLDATGSPGAIDGPRVVVLHGRGRRIGPVLDDPDELKANLEILFDVIGADCECGLDRSWFDGPAIPLVWGNNDRRRAAAALGFDPESPLVKIEVSQILTRGDYTGAASGSLVPGPGGTTYNLLGYAPEVGAAEGAQPEAALLSPAQFQGLMAPQTGKVGAAREVGPPPPIRGHALSPPTVAEVNTPLKWSYAILIAMGSVVVAIGALGLLVHWRRGNR